ncbi:MAG: peptidylprolyl isomerase [Flavobacteriaceae bacterium]|nr:peptidylprolyl isomerase [Flavobacteriaceae bacterium]MDG1790152.1 peptidylprolyl isomerase [Flavobacteriaceae bacterium]MDG2447627.1 peptidylprolyl isomerase [Flavobacteriaceae bacterium]
MKFSRKTNWVLLFAVMVFSQSFCQEVVTIDSTGVVKSSDVDPQITVNDSINNFKRYKAEGVCGVVGDFVILEFDIDKSYLEFEQNGVDVNSIDRCEMIGKLMEDKLYVHHAIQDSIIISDAEIKPEVDQLMAYMVDQVGSVEKVVNYYRKSNETELRADLMKARKEIRLTERMQENIVSSITITPEEVRTFFFSIPVDERPIFSAELEVSQLVIEPEVTEKARQDAINRLKSIRTDIVDNGSSFATKAVLYSKDGTRSKGGVIEGVRKDSPMAKEFKDMAFSLQEGEVSEPFETEFGFHLLKVDKVRGQQVDVRHIIIFPEVSQSIVNEARKKIDTIRQSILDNKIPFAEAAKLYSDDKETRNNGGLLVNPQTLDTRFDLTKMDPTLSAQVYNVKKGEITKVYTDSDRTGKSIFKILTVTNRHEEHVADYVKDYEKVHELALKEKQLRAIEDWQEEKIKETYIKISSDYKDCNFTNNWINKEN